MPNLIVSSDPGDRRETLFDVRGIGRHLPRGLRRRLECSLSADLTDVRILRSSSVERVHAPAAAMGNLIVLHPAIWSGFECRQTLHVLVHELVHVLQQREGRVRLNRDVPSLVFDVACEAEAELLADTIVRDLTSPSNHSGRLGSRRAKLRESLAPPNGAPGASRWVIQAHPAAGVIRRAITWVGRRGGKALSKHIATHTRRNFGKAIHTVFRSINDIRPLINQTLKEGVELTQHFAKSSGLEVVEHAGVRLTRQASRTPGKIRWLLQKEFRSPIGSAGERVLCIVLDVSGRLVTAFPADKLLVIFGVVGASQFVDSVANAAENVAVEADRLAALKEKQRARIDIDEFVPGIGAIWGGRLNEFEDLELAFDGWVDAVVKDVIAGSEWKVGLCFDGTTRQTLENVVRTAMGLPILLEHEH
jgi:hypothetical protein